MQLTFTEEQQALRKTVRDFANKRSPVTRFRTLRDNPTGAHDPELWRSMAELGWTGVAIPEAQDGLGLGYTELSIIAEELGYTLSSQPLNTALFGAIPALLASEDDNHASIVAEVLEGRAYPALAYAEKGQRYDRRRCKTRATQREGQWVIEGVKTDVAEGNSADHFVVTARVDGSDNDPGGVALFVVPANAGGLQREALSRIDRRDAAQLTFRDVRAQRLTLENDTSTIERIFDLYTLGLCAEMLGGAQAAFDQTLAYIKERVQFGKPIGSFQALQHRAARCFAELTLMRSSVVAASRAADEAPGDFPRFVSAAKALCSAGYTMIAHEGIQMHGGVGVTDEYDIGLYLKRARVCEFTLGDAAWHRARWATLSGY